MITLEGTAKQPGIAIAVAAKVDAKSGINGISHTLLMSGISALRAGLMPADYPEAILACDNLALGAVMRIPGISAVGIVAESDTDAPGLTVEWPCVIGVSNLLGSITEGDIVIVDGYKGMVHIDPDPDTLIHYQQAEEHRHLRESIFIASEHIPAHTQTGETVLVYALVPDELQLAKALDLGADGLLTDLRGNREDVSALVSHILREAAGKPVVFAIDLHCEEILRATLVYCVSDQVTLVSDNADLLASQVEYAMDRVVLEALQLDVQVPQVNIGAIGRAGDSYSPLVVEVSDPDPESVTLVEYNPEQVVIISKIETIEPLVLEGVRRIAVEVSAVAEAKNAVRLVGLEDEE